MQRKLQHSEASIRCLRQVVIFRARWYVRFLSLAAEMVPYLEVFAHMILT